LALKIQAKRLRAVGLTHHIHTAQLIEQLRTMLERQRRLAAFVPLHGLITRKAYDKPVALLSRIPQEAQMPRVQYVETA
jgi:hypothetical protein